MCFQTLRLLRSSTGELPIDLNLVILGSRRWLLFLALSQSGCYIYNGGKIQCAEAMVLLGSVLFFDIQTIDFNERPIECTPSPSPF